MGEYAFLLGIATVFMLGTISPGPSFILIAKTAVSKSRKEGFGVAIGLGLGAVVLFSFSHLRALCDFRNRAFLVRRFKNSRGLYLVYLAYKMWKYANTPLETTLSLEQKPKSFFKAVLFGFATQDEQSKNSYHHRKYLCRAASKRDTAFWNAVHLLHRFYH